MTGTAIASIAPRHRATVSGEIRSVRCYRLPHPRTEVELDDGTGVLLLRFMGRTGLPGVSPGRRMHADGTPGDERGTLVMLNPLYCFGPPA